MTTVPEGFGPDQPDSETLLRRVTDVIGNAKSMPLSSSVMISRDEVLELLEEAINRLPEQLRQARWLLKEREEFLNKVQAEADDILAAARLRAERMVQRTEIVLERTMKTVRAGRAKLRVTPLPERQEAEIAGAEDSGEHEAFFDQDEP